LIAGLNYRITGEFYIPSTNSHVDGVRVYDSSAGIDTRFNTPTLDAWVSFNITDTAAAPNFQFSPLDGGSTTVGDAGGDDVFYVRNIKVEQLNKLHNDAIQSTASSQPKVISAGALVTDANGNYALDFDGTDDHFDVATINEAQPITGFVVVDMASTVGEASQDILDGTAADTNRILLDKSGSTWRLFAGASLTGPAFTDNVDLIYFLANGASSAVGLDGATPTAGDAGTNSGWASGLTIGTSISGGFMDGSLATIVIYGSDQSANRSGIEQILSNTITTALS